MGARLSKLLDGIVRLVNPRRAALRAHFREFERNAEYRVLFGAMLNARGYRAAARGEGVTPWLGGTKSADAEILTDLGTMQARMREINRDDPLGSGLTGTFVRNVIGTGLRAQARTKDDQLNRDLESIWAERRDNLYLADDLCDQEGQALAFRKFVEDGEVFVRQAKRTESDPIWFELVEAERVSTPTGKMDGPQANGGELCKGVERDSASVPVAYYVHRGRQADAFGTPATYLKWDRVPRDMIRHLRIVERPGQTRGVPMMHAVVQDLHDLDLLLLASLKRVQIAACLSVFIKSQQKIEDIFQATAKEYGYRLDQQLEPGMIFKLFPDEDVQTVSPNFPTPELEPFIIMLARRIGAALGVSWQVVLKDFSQSTYSSARTDLLETRQVYVFLQAWFAKRCLSWQWIAVMLDAQLRGDTRAAGLGIAELSAVEWIGDGWQWIDPMTEAQALELSVKRGFKSFAQVWRQQGYDPDQMRADIESESDLRELLFPDLSPVRSSPENGEPSSDTETSGIRPSRFHSRMPPNPAGGNGQ